MEYWVTRLSVCSYARTAHSFACSGLLASLAPSAALAHFAHSLARGKGNDKMAVMSVFFPIFDHSFGLKKNHANKSILPLNGVPYNRTATVAIFKKKSNYGFKKASDGFFILRLPPAFY